ncbi:hypothetical protein HPB47_027629 [Ixodes persulcatus]|uniref:Uncharacterized protein n=1 Tax=Ixodes persulcatus TaxID=34615 RepID=A0AC60PVW7_IXOPE|nr:hypothetical protein HPB47_027629 [Ixodes persulcatus]
MVKLPVKYLAIDADYEKLRAVRRRAERRVRRTGKAADWAEARRTLARFLGSMDPQKPLTRLWNVTRGLKKTPRQKFPFRALALSKVITERAAANASASFSSGAPRFNNPEGTLGTAVKKPPRCAGIVVAEEHEQSVEALRVQETLRHYSRVSTPHEARRLADLHTSRPASSFAEVVRNHVEAFLANTAPYRHPQRAPWTWLTPTVYLSIPDEGKGTVFGFLHGILKALHYIEATSLKSYVVCTNSKLFLASLSTTAKKCAYSGLHQAILDTNDTLHKTGYDITYQWVPGHVGVTGNKIVDTTAAREHKNEITEAIPVAKADVKSIFCGVADQIMVNIWEQPGGHPYHLCNLDPKL